MLKDHVLDPRVLLWLSIAGFFLGYFVWEVLFRAISDRARRREDRKLPREFRRYEGRC